MTIKLPFTVMGGYLGAGKTTLLNHVLTNTRGLRIAVLVNDFGRVNIDASLVRSHAGDTINLSNGCMCCSIADNFALVMGRLSDRPNDFDHIIIEASGIANPSKIAQYGQMYRLPLDGIIVVADAEQVRAQAQNKYVGDMVLRQFAQADVIILNKIDLITASELARLRGWFAEIASGTPLYETIHAEVPTAVLLGAHKTYPPIDLSDPFPQNHLQNLDSNSHGFESWTVERSHPLSREAIAHFAAHLGADIYRAKGFVSLEKDPAYRYRYQQVGKRWSLEPDSPWEDELRLTQLVVIGRKGGASIQGLEELLERAIALPNSVYSRIHGD